MGVRSVSNRPVTDPREPEPGTPPHLLAILEELRAREPVCHRPEFGTTRADFEAQLAEDFWEVEASGRRYSREFVLDSLEARWSAPHEDRWETTEFHVRDLGLETYALTYTLRQDARVTRRLTLWRKIEGVWKALYHQGTIVSGGG